jgi:hypothetical protein
MAILAKPVPVSLFVGGPPCAVLVCSDQFKYSEKKLGKTYYEVLVVNKANFVDCDSSPMEITIRP